MVDDAGFVADYKLRQPDQKRHAVNALKSLNYQVIAAGDSYNDTGMLGAADAGFFIHPPPGIVAQFPQFPVQCELCGAEGFHRRRRRAAAPGALTPRGASRLGRGPTAAMLWAHSARL